MESLLVSLRRSQRICDTEELGWRFSNYNFIPYNYGYSGIISCLDLRLGGGIRRVAGE